MCADNWTRDLLNKEKEVLTTSPLRSVSSIKETKFCPPIADFENYSAVSQSEAPISLKEVSVRGLLYAVLLMTVEFTFVSFAFWRWHLNCSCGWQPLCCSLHFLLTLPNLSLSFVRKQCSQYSVFELLWCFNFVASWGKSLYWFVTLLTYWTFKFRIKEFRIKSLRLWVQLKYKRVITNKLSYSYQ
jgi:hypothetical protein